MSDVPKADPEAARDIAVKHFFRHLDDEQELLRNPLVGPELLSGNLTAHDLRVRVARAATIIRDHDATIGRSDRGNRQAACLIRCDLGSQDVASLAAEFAISPRQLARERHEAWLRALPHVLPKTAHLATTSLNDIVTNRALALFRLGRERDAVAIMREHIARSESEAAMFGLCSLARMQYDFKRIREARETFRELRQRLPAAVRSRSRLDLAVCLLDVLVDGAIATHAWNTRIRELARRAALETPAASWITLTNLRLFFSLSQKFVCTNDYKNLLAVCSSIDELSPSVDDFDDHDALALHAVKSISECKQNGFTPNMEAHVLRVLHLAVANGWTSVVAEAASLLSSSYYLSGGIGAARNYRDMALSAVTLTDDRGSIALTYANLATAALDSGCVAAAAKFSDLQFVSKRDDQPLLEHIPLVVAEILVGQGHAKQGIAQARDVLLSADRAGNTRLVAIAGRVVALGLKAAGERRAANATMKESLDRAAAGYCSKFDAQRIERSYRNLDHSNRVATAESVTYREFCT